MKTMTSIFGDAFFVEQEIKSLREQRAKQLQNFRKIRSRIHARNKQITELLAISPQEEVGKALYNGIRVVFDGLEKQEQKQLIDAIATQVSGKEKRSLAATAKRKIVG